jgi:hypothetical protein
VKLPQVRFPGDVAVVLEKEGTQRSQPDELTTIKVYSGELERKVMAVRPGSIIRFQSVDPFDHELYSPGMDDFRPERQASGGFRPIEFKKEGVQEIRCKLMPHFRGYVVVTGAMAILKVEQDGSFSMDDLSDGKYAVKVFFDGKWVYEQAFEIEKNQKHSVNLEINLASEPTPGKSDQAKESGKKKPDEKVVKP